MPVRVLAVSALMTLLGQFLKRIVNLCNLCEKTIESLISPYFVESCMNE